MNIRDIIWYNLHIRTWFELIWVWLDYDLIILYHPLAILGILAPPRATAVLEHATASWTAAFEPSPLHLVARLPLPQKETKFTRKIKSKHIRQDIFEHYCGIHGICSLWLWHAVLTDSLFEVVDCQMVSSCFISRIKLHNWYKQMQLGWCPAP